ncbi:MAG: ATP-binding protein [Desulfobulbaceae bacterium]|nr:ATP-binding protein [Desulfobulbaceae bacterium]
MQFTHKKNILIDSINRNEKQSNIAFSWLLLLRWGALLSQAFIVLAIVLLVESKPPLFILLVIFAYSAGSNIAFHFFFHKKNRIIPGWLFAQVMVVDILLLTLLLYYTGGAMNPFTFLYLIHICLGAILMQSFWAWSLALYTMTCYGILFFLPEPGGASHAMPEGAHFDSSGMEHSLMSLHLQGMWLAFAMTVFFIVFFINKIQKDLEENRQNISRLETQKIKSEKLASLATLSAGAAHEFSTPLATIAIASGEMLSILNEQNADKELIDDIMLIREQVKRCREILYQMSADAGEHLAESLRDFTLKELFSKVISGFPEDMRRQVRFDCDMMDFTIRMPFRTVYRIIRGLIKNAIDVSGPELPVFVSCRKDDNYLYIKVRDLGVGMDEETLSRAVEPFYTTKETGNGLGLGLFLAESAAERFGGKLDLASSPAEGTTAVISFSLKQIQSS